MNNLTQILEKIPDQGNRIKIIALLNRIKADFSNLKLEAKWNQPMFTDHGTFILGFSFAKDHFSVAAEKATLERFKDAVVASGYYHTAMLFHIKWKQEIDYRLLKEIIAFNIKDKEKHQGFWR